MDQHDERAASRHADERSDWGEDRVEDYLLLDEFVSQLQADRRPRRPKRMTPKQARVYQTAAMLRAEAPGAAEPDPAFVERLHAQLDREVRGTHGRPVGTGGPSVSRRGLLAGGLGAAAAAAGVAAGVGLDRLARQQSPTQTNTTPLVTQGEWVAVAAVAALPVGSVKRFVTDQVVGFVQHTSTGFLALSGACTHMGCLLAWNGAARTFDCPCHGGRFLDDGNPSPSSPIAYTPLPHISTRVQDGQVWVYLPVTGKAPSGNDTPDPGLYQPHAKDPNGAV